MEWRQDTNKHDMFDIQFSFSTTSMLRNHTYLQSTKTSFKNLMIITYSLNNFPKEMIEELLPLTSMARGDSF